MDASHLRRELLDHLCANPGASTRALAAAVGRAESTAAYHLRRLAREGAARSQLVGRDRCWYASSCGLCPVLRRALPVLRRPDALAAARALSATPTTHVDLSRATGVPAGAMRWATAELERAFLAQRTPRGRVRLREGAELCLEAVNDGRACSLWGTCAVSAAWRASLAPEALTSSR